eukprot:gb/GEZN01001460.1/.p1 GENE.gb/GEZN01001460.1/~~gb/GEZN01001460.1/.p1  ORF type:complete len:927 (+),score=212.99 gb/GEZN01001460.1/:67-2847(+)
MSGFDYTALDGNPVSPLLNPVKAAVGTVGMLLVGAAGWLATHTGMRQAVVVPRVLSASTDGAPPVAFQPLDGTEAVTIRPGSPASFMLAVNPDMLQPKAVFLYGSHTHEGPLSQGSESKEGWVYGAELHSHYLQGQQDPVQYAVPTGKSEHVMKGKLVKWPAVGYLDLLKKADKLHFHDPKREARKSLVHRGVVPVVDEDGKSTTAYWYYQDESNPLLDQAGLPLFSVIQAKHVEPATAFVLALAASKFEAWEKLPLVERTKYVSVIEDMERLQAPLSYVWGAVSHLVSVKNDAPIREANENMQPEVIQFSSSVGQSKALYESLKGLQSNHLIWTAMDSTQHRIVDKSILGMELSGVGLAGRQQDKFNEITVKLAELSTKYSNNVLDATKAYGHLVTKKEEIAGMTFAARALAASNAVKNGYVTDANPEEGPWLLTLDGPSYQAVMQHLDSQSLREKVYRARLRLASEDELKFDNSGILLDILKLKKERAKLLGYSSHAQLSLKEKMAPDVDAVEKLMDLLYRSAHTQAKEELKTLEAYAAKAQHQDKVVLNNWDVGYWSEKQKKELYEVDDEAMRPYFPLGQVLEGLFGLAERLFNVKVQEAPKGSVEVWHPTVQFFDLKSQDSKTGEPLASFYFDPFSRPSEKNGGAWMNTFSGKSKVLGTRPVAYVICNSSPPTKEAPSLLTFREVQTLFHEFGHALQHMLTTVPYSDAAGIHLVEWDAVELASQFLENFVLHKETLFSFARHHKTKEALPQDNFEKLVALSKYEGGWGMVRQVYLSQIDMKLHSDQFDPEKATISDVWKLQQETAEYYLPMKPAPGDRFLCGFSHIFAGGYSAGYYSYKWAEVMSADAFGAFEETKFEDKAVRNLGRKFRDTVLALGGSKPADEVFRLFRGRDPQPDALLRHTGCTGATAEAAGQASLTEAL